MAEIQTYSISGKLKFPSLATPQSFDSESRKFYNDFENGDYSTYLECPADDIQTKEHFARFNNILAEHVQNLEKGDKYPSNLEIIMSDIPAFDGYTDKEKTIKSGNIEFKFKRAAKNKLGKVSKPRVFNGVPALMTQEEIEAIGNGSHANIIFTIYTWDKLTKDTKTKTQYIECGIGLCLLDVQITRLVKNQQCPFGPVADWNPFPDDLIGEDEIPY